MTSTGRRRCLARSAGLGVLGVALAAGCAGGIGDGADNPGSARGEPRPGGMAAPGVQPPPGAGPSGLGGSGGSMVMDPGAPGAVDTRPPINVPPAPSLKEAFTCKNAAATAGPRRLWRLTNTQYRNTIAFLFNGRMASVIETDMKRIKEQSSLRDASAPFSMLEMFDPSNPADRYSNVSISYTMGDGEFRLSFQSARDIAGRLVQNARDKGCLGKTAFADCVKTQAQQRAEILFSRPLTQAEADKYVALALKGQPMLGDDRALATVFQSMLLSPSFLFRSELGGGTPDGSGAYRTSSYEVAAALAYTLTDLPPDAELWKAAQSDALTTPEQIRAQLERLLTAYPPKQPMVRRFLNEYWRYRNVFQVFKDEKKYPYHKADKLVQETEAALEDVLANNVRKDFLKSMLTFGDVWIHGDNPKSYNLETTYNDNLLCRMTGDFNCTRANRVKPPAGQRAGMLTQPSWLAGISKPEETEPVQRGRFIAESLLCQTVPSLPIGQVPQLPNLATANMRDKLSMHSKDPGCWACHQMMDPLGLAFEAYDHTGRWRNMDAAKPIDTTGALSGSANVDGAFMDVLDLANKLAASQTVGQCFVRNSFVYWMGRQDAAGDSCSLTAAYAAYQKNGDYVELLASLFTSRSFTHRSVTP